MRTLAYAVFLLGSLAAPYYLWRHDWWGAVLMALTLVALVNNFPAKKRV